MLEAALACRAANHLADALTGFLVEQRAVDVAPHQFLELVAHGLQLSAVEIVHGHHRMPQAYAKCSRFGPRSRNDFRRKFSSSRGRSRGAAAQPVAGAVSRARRWHPDVRAS